MITLPDYEIQEVILEDPHIWVCRAFCQSTSRNVTLKIVKDGQRSMIENAKLMHEYEITSKLDIRGILKPIKLLRQGNALAITFEWVDGVTFQHYVTTHRIPISLFLHIAIKVCEILDSLHQQKILHMNIRPETIVVVPGSYKVYLTGFGHAITTSVGNHQLRSVPLMEGSPPYMSPERTRRMSWGIDGRSDLYSLGIAFYELLTGRLPFTATDPIQWAHAHLAQQPTPIRNNIAIPPVVIAIINKLLQKNPRDRYQSAYGLLADLKKCHLSHEKNGVVEMFELGLQDRSILLAPTQLESFQKEDPQESKQPVEVNYSQILDLAVVIKASQAFSEEPDPEKLLQELMQIMIETSGGQTAILFSVKNRYLYIEAIARVGEQVILYQKPASLTTCPQEISEEVINHVLATEKLLIVDEASIASLTSSNLNRSRIPRKSILGMPVFIQGVMVAILYVENNLTSNVFTRERTGILQMLSSQMIYLKQIQVFFSNKINRCETNPFIPKSHVPLTEREQEILLLLEEGLTNKEIAEKLFLASGTVKIHVKNIREKLQVTNRIKAVAQARLLGLL